MLFYSKTLSYTSLLPPPLGWCVLLFHCQTFILTSLHPSPWESSARLAAGQPNSSHVSRWLASFMYSCFHSFYRWGNWNKVQPTAQDHTTRRGDITQVSDVATGAGDRMISQRDRPLPSKSLHAREPQLCVSAAITLHRNTNASPPISPPTRLSRTKFTALSLSLLSSSHSSSQFSSSFAFPRGTHLLFHKIQKPDTVT